MTEATTAKPRRPRGEGSIYTDAKGRVRGAIVIVEPGTGRRFRRVVSGTSRGDVQAKLDKLRRDADSGIGIKPGAPRTVGAYAAVWLPAQRARVRPSTWSGYEHLLRLRVLPALGAVPLRQLTPSDVERMTAGMVRGGLSPTSARGARAVLRMILRDAERDGLVARNVAALARPPRIERHELRVLTAEQTRQLLDGTAEDELGPLYAVAALTGLRQGEVLGLRWQDVELAGPSPSLTVRRSLALDANGGRSLAEPKSRRSRRTLDLPPAAVAALRRQKARQAEARLAAGDAWRGNPDKLCFTDAIGRPVTPSAVSHGFPDALRRLGLPHVRFHDLRHGCASLLLAQGVSLKVVSETLGHASISLTADTYLHLDREQRREAARAIERAIGGE